MITIQARRNGRGRGGTAHPLESDRESESAGVLMTHLVDYYRVTLEARSGYYAGSLAGRPSGRGRRATASCLHIVAPSNSDGSWIHPQGRLEHSWSHMYSIRCTSNSLVSPSGRKECTCYLTA